MTEFLKRIIAFFTRPPDRCSFCYKKIEDDILKIAEPIKITCEDPKVKIIRRLNCRACMRKAAKSINHE